MNTKLIYDYAYIYVIYGSIHLFSDIILTRIFSKKVIQKLSRDDRIDLGEKVSSAVNGLITGILSIYIVFYQNAFKGDIYNPYNSYMDTFFTNLVAYSLYDLTVMYFQNNDITLHIHHWCALTGSILSPIYKDGCFFPIIFGITELTVITNNFTWYLQRLDFKNTELYQNSLFLRAVVFTLIRPFCGVYAIYYAIQNPGPIPSGYPVSSIQDLTLLDKISVSWANFMNMHILPRVLSFVFMLMLVFLNFAWTYVILSNYMKKTKTRID